jgi:peptidoglycan/LPS O-acetylase OafA/YrhL
MYHQKPGMVSPSERREVSAQSQVPGSRHRYPVLDGWRGISILCVLATHMLPLGPKSWQLNLASGTLGMCLFFTLSGFLITSTLLYYANVRDFLIRRFCRILPLAFTYLMIVMPLISATPAVYAAHFLFYANIPPFWLHELTAHYWSLCVEMQFYLAIAFLFTAFGRRGLMLLPAFCLAVTLGRVYTNTPISVVTYLRIDEILVGGCLALMVEGYFGKVPVQILKRSNAYPLLAVLLVSCHPSITSINYMRPYLAAALVGTTLYQSQSQFGMKLLQLPQLAYIANISYALYVIHPLTMYGWLGSGDKMVKYAKRILSFGLTFSLAHLSTYQFENRWIAWGKQWTSNPVKP